MATRGRPKPDEVQPLFEPAAQMTRKIIGGGIEKTLPRPTVITQTERTAKPAKKGRLAKPNKSAFQMPQRGTPAYRNFRALPAARQRLLRHQGRSQGWQGGATGTTAPMVDAGSGRGTAPKGVSNLERLVAKKISKVKL